MNSNQQSKRKSHWYRNTHCRQKIWHSEGYRVLAEFSRVSHLESPGQGKSCSCIQWSQTLAPGTQHSSSTCKGLCHEEYSRKSSLFSNRGVLPPSWI